MSEEEVEDLFSLVENIKKDKILYKGVFIQLPASSVIRFIVDLLWLFTCACQSIFLL